MKETKQDTAMMIGSVVCGVILMWVFIYLANNVDCLTWLWIILSIASLVIVPFLIMSIIMQVTGPKIESTKDVPHYNGIDTDEDFSEFLK